MSNSIDIIHRFLLSRAYVDENALILAQCIEAQNRDVDVVFIDKDTKDYVKELVGDSDLKCFMLNMDDKLCLLYPKEQRDLYLNHIRPYIVFGKNISEYQNFTFSEAMMIQDALNKINVKYKSSLQSDGRIKIAISKRDSNVLEDIIQMIAEEIKTTEGEKFYISQNMCLENAANIASLAINMDDISYVGMEGGSGGIKIDKEGAIIAIPNHKIYYIPREDFEFESKMLKIILEDMNGKNTPVKVFFGMDAKMLCSDIELSNIGQNVLSKSEAMDILGRNSLMSQKEIMDAINNLEAKDFTGLKKKAFLTLARMSVCRDTKLEEFSKYKMTQKDKTKFNLMHDSNINRLIEKYKNRTDTINKDDFKIIDKDKNQIPSTRVQPYVEKGIDGHNHGRRLLDRNEESR